MQRSAIRLVPEVRAITALQRVGGPGRPSAGGSPIVGPAATGWDRMHVAGGGESTLFVGSRHRRDDVSHQGAGSSACRQVMLRDSRPRSPERSIGRQPSFGSSGHSPPGSGCHSPALGVRLAQRARAARCATGPRWDGSLRSSSRRRDRPGSFETHTRSRSSELGRVHPDSSVFGTTSWTGIRLGTRRGGRILGGHHR